MEAQPLNQHLKTKGDDGNCQEPTGGDLISGCIVFHAGFPCTSLSTLRLPAEAVLKVKPGAENEDQAGDADGLKLQQRTAMTRTPGSPERLP